MPVVEPTEENLARAAAVIRNGGLVAFPTETVYGLGADAFNPVAAGRIFEVKRRPFFDPLIVHIADPEQLRELTTEASGTVRLLAGRFWPGPLTLVLPKLERVPDLVTAGLPTVAVRMPAHEAALRLIRLAGRPVAAPSANPFGYISPTTAAHVSSQLGAAVDLILDGGPCAVGVESTILKVEGSRLLLLRPGGAPLEEIEAVAGPVLRLDGIAGGPEAPGQLPSHYSPATPVRIVERILQSDLGLEGARFLFFRDPGFPVPARGAALLSAAGDLREVAANLFSALHRLDATGGSVIIAERVPEHGLGLAIMDRLVKAAGKK